MSTNTAKTRKLTQLAILIAIEAIFSFIPILGSIPIGPLVATTAHLPVILAGVLLGVQGGAILGFCFGLFSFLVHSFITPTITSFVFTPIVSVGAAGGSVWSLVICFVPRILLGVVAALLYKGLSRLDKRGGWSYITVGILSSLFHTVSVLMLIYFCFGETYAAACGLAGNLLLGAIGTVIATNGLLEAALAAVTTVAVAKPVQLILKKAQTR